MDTHLGNYASAYRARKPAPSTICELQRGLAYCSTCELMSTESNRTRLLQFHNPSDHPYLAWRFPDPTAFLECFRNQWPGNHICHSSFGQWECRSKCNSDKDLENCQVWWECQLYYSIRCLSGLGSNCFFCKAGIDLDCYVVPCGWSAKQFDHFSSRKSDDKLVCSGESSVIGKA